MRPPGAANTPEIARPIRSRDEVAYEFCRRNPGERLSRGGAFVIHQRAIEKLRLALADDPQVGEWRSVP